MVFHLWITKPIKCCQSKWIRILHIWKLNDFIYGYVNECVFSGLHSHTIEKTSVKFLIWNLSTKKKASLLYCYTTMRIVGWWHPTINAIKTITNCQAEELPIITRSAITKCISNSFTMLGNLGKLPRIIGSFYRDFPLPPPLLLLYPTNSRFSHPHFLFQYKSSWVEKGLSKKGALARGICKCRVCVYVCVGCVQLEADMCSGR